MEKRNPRYRLEDFKASDFSITTIARKNAFELGLTMDDVHDAVSSMKPGQFYKSMTSYADHTKWQDVYHVPYGDWLLYIKFTEDAVTEFRLLSFKEK